MLSICFLALSFGSWFAFRTLSDLVAEGFLAKKHLAKIGTLIVLFFFSLALLIRSAILILFLSISICVCFHSLSYLLSWYRYGRFRRLISPLLNQIILYMRSGFSFRSALLASVEDFAHKTPWAQFHLRELHDSVVFSQQIIWGQSDPALEDFIDEMRMIEQDSQRRLERLQSYRVRLQFESALRRRSGQVSLQIRLQAVLMTLIYVFLVIYVFYSSGTKHLSLVFFSFILFLVGFICVFQMGNRVKWRV